VYQILRFTALRVVYRATRGLPRYAWFTALRVVYRATRGLPRYAWFIVLRVVYRTTRGLPRYAWFTVLRVVYHATRSLPIILGQFSRYSAGLSTLFLIFTRFARKINTILEYHPGIIKLKVYQACSSPVVLRGGVGGFIKLIKFPIRIFSLE
jgi:hypothetical protein